MEIDVLFKIAAVGLIAAVLNQILARAGKEEYTMLVTLAGMIAVIMLLLPSVRTLFETVRSVFGL
ncbi:MAG: stage III sporulation protein AC [Clostridia bacterium]|nr:stage III sporulation protein AC [Clostridia bacterium]MBR0509302.1 stage III sporulation protein AC [Clostridia bacterium]MBR0537663.1 stage III sporulation protein AC [Clostridia bacterium]